MDLAISPQAKHTNIWVILIDASFVVPMCTVVAAMNQTENIAMATAKINVSGVDVAPNFYPA